MVTGVSVAVTGMSISSPQIFSVPTPTPGNAPTVRVHTGAMPFSATATSQIGIAGALAVAMRNISRSIEPGPARPSTVAWS